MPNGEEWNSLAQTLQVNQDTLSELIERLRQQIWEASGLGYMFGDEPEEPEKQLGFFDE